MAYFPESFPKWNREKDALQKRACSLKLAPSSAPKFSDISTHAIGQSILPDFSRILFYPLLPFILSSHADLQFLSGTRELKGRFVLVCEAPIDRCIEKYSSFEWDDISFVPVVMQFPCLNCHHEE
jgi:hypothetical protein